VSVDVENRVLRDGSDRRESVGYHQGGVVGRDPFGPSMEGIGLRRALAIGMRGTPWITRGSFMRVGSSLAGTSAESEMPQRYRQATYFD
jgi:hypothetical protein